MAELQALNVRLLAKRAAMRADVEAEQARAAAATERRAALAVSSKAAFAALAKANPDFTREEAMEVYRAQVRQREALEAELTASG